jgi:hypothetical protein
MRRWRAGYLRVRVLSWLRQGERDRGADEVEGLALFAGGLGEHRDGRGGAGDADLVAGQGAQVGEQAARRLPNLAPAPGVGAADLLK